MFLPSSLNLGASFSKYFQIVPAWTEDMKDEVYRIRHQVYCEELRWEPLRLDRRESDEYDRHSLHLLIRSNRTGEFIGCVRLIRPDTFEDSLPFEMTCTETLNRSICDPSQLPRDRIAEVSRLAIVAPFRRRKGEARHSVSLQDTDFGTPDQPRFLYAPIGLYLGALELARIQGIETLFILTEPRLASHFARLGARLIPVGPPVEHRGTRIPSMMEPEKILNNLPYIFRSFYEVIAEAVGQCPVPWYPHKSQISPMALRA